MAEYSIPTSAVSKVMIKIAQNGFSNKAPKLLELGVNPSSSLILGSQSEAILHIFAHLGDVSTLGFLPGGRAKVDAGDNYGRTALTGGKNEVAKVLPSRGADVNAIDTKGRTALYGAAGGGFTDTVRRLLSHNANITIRGGKKNETILERARKNRRFPVIELINARVKH
ncbi:hypothetical protein SCUP515_12581 [Seiridium cupressi]